MPSHRTRSQLHGLLKTITAFGDEGMVDIRQAKRLRFGMARLTVLLDALVAVGLVVQRSDGTWTTKWAETPEAFHEAIETAVADIDRQAAGREP